MLGLPEDSRGETYDVVAAWARRVLAVERERERVLGAVAPLLAAHRAFPAPSYPGAVLLTATGQTGSEDVAGTVALLAAARASAERLIEGP